jgi:alpha-beta hydrolase superfamily lysophospholipase
MDVIREEYRFDSATGVCRIFARSIAPADKTKVRGVLQVVHGMAEHGERYQVMAYYMAYHGYAVFIHDHAGHGRSVENDTLLGYFGEKDGWKALIEDVRILAEKAMEKYPNRPMFLLGHSMGSFVARAYAAQYGDELTGAIFCGTSGANPGAAAGIAVAGIVEKFKGELYRSPFIDHIAFGSYNKRYENPRTPFDWLSRDESEVDLYIKDPYCGFLFTAAGYKDMFTLLQSVSGKAWYRSVPKKLPILLISGSMDPVGGYGKGVRQVYADLMKTGHENVKIRVYDGARHELFNETNAKDVLHDLLEWADGTRKKAAE